MTDLARALLTLSLLSCFACATQAEPASSKTSAALGEFQAICEAQASDEYFGTQVIADLRARVEQPALPLNAQVAMRRRLARELRRVGQLDESIALFEEALVLGGSQTAEGLLLEIKRDLALSHLLLAEDENCVAAHGPLACSLPIAPDAVHARPEHTRRAGDLLRDFLAQRPDNLEARWLLNISRMVAGDFPGDIPESQRLATEALASDEPFERWPDRATHLGVDAFDLAGGAVMDDFDGDGLLDLVTSTWDPCDHPKAFRNDGRGGFENVTATWGLDQQLGGLNLIHADYDNDGRLDLLILRGAWRGQSGAVRNSLLRNTITEQGGGFEDVTRAVGIDTARPTQTAAWADFDGDGDLDLYVGNESSRRGTFASELWRNDGPREDGDWRFTDIAVATGVDNLRMAKGVAWGDHDDDGDPDLYVSNIGVNRLYRNEGPGTDGAWRFTDIAESLGVTEPIGASFATWFFDHDNDGDLDLFVADYSAPFERVFASYLDVPSHSGQPRLYRNDGGRFTEISRASGLERPLLPMGANHGDLDNDGFLDLYLGTGLPNLEAVMPNIMYRNDGGQRFRDVSAAGGFAHVQKGHGVAFGDLDNDGDQDLFEQMGGALPVDAFFNALYENPGAGDQDGHQWLTLRLEGRTANRFAIGARIEVRVRDSDTGTRSIHRLVGSGGSFGGSSLQAEIGLGRATSIEAVVIRWPGGVEQVVRDLEPNRFYRVVEGRGAEPITLPSFQLGASGPATSANDHHAGHAASASRPTRARAPATELPRVRTHPAPTLTSTPTPDASLTTEEAAVLRGRLAKVRPRVKASPKALSPHHDLIAVYLEAKQYRHAMAAASNAVRALPRSPEPRFLRGVVALSRGTLGDAEIDFRQALTLDPRHVPALNNLAAVVAARGATVEAIEILDRVLAIDPNDAMALGNLAKLKEEHGDGD